MTAILDSSQVTGYNSDIEEKRTISPKFVPNWQSSLRQRRVFKRSILKLYPLMDARGNRYKSERGLSKDHFTKVLFELVIQFQTRSFFKYFPISSYCESTFIFVDANFCGLQKSRGFVNFWFYTCHIIIQWKFCSLLDMEFRGFIIPRKLVSH